MDPARAFYVPYLMSTVQKNVLHCPAVGATSVSKVDAEETMDEDEGLARRTVSRFS
jgi:hypothetical protein